jgi:hypothetical protein
MDTLSLSDSMGETDEGFVEADWIGVGKIYDETLPSLVRSAKRTSLAIPNTFLNMARLPDPATSVIDFIKSELPCVSSEIIVTKAVAWFTNDAPSESVDLGILLSRSVPSAQFIEELEQVVGQRWLDGAKSITDLRFNDGRDRLPLWVLSFWRTVVDMVKVRQAWNEAICWLEREAAKTKHSKNTLQAIPSVLVPR